MRAAITGVAGYVPEKKLTNRDLEKIVDTSDEWIKTRTGINERRILDKNLPTSFMCIKAVGELLRKTNTSPHDIDMVICATMTPDMQTPSTANIISAALDIKNAVGYDIQSACSGFLYALIIAEKFILSGGFKKIIVIGGDKMSSVTNFKDRNTCILFGDGAGAIMLEPNDYYGIKSSILKSDGGGIDLLKVPGGGSLLPGYCSSIKKEDFCIHQEGRKVYKYAVSKMVEIVQELVEKNNIDLDNIKYLVPHQANRRIIEAVCQRLNFPLTKTIINLDKYGNTTGATIPLCLWDYEKKFHRGDELIFLVFGAGFTWGAAHSTWAY